MATRQGICGVVGTPWAGRVSLNQHPRMKWCESLCAPAIPVTRAMVDFNSHPHRGQHHSYQGGWKAQCVSRSVKRGTLVQTYDEMDWEKVQARLYI